VAAEPLLSLRPAGAQSESRSEEADLVARAQGGDERALEALVRLAAPGVLSAARAITRDPALAEDAAQEAFLRTFRALQRFRPEGSFRAWVRTIAIRTAIDLLRRRKPETSISEFASPVARETSRNDADLPVSALVALALVDREILIAREIEGAADLEIARRLGLSVTALRVRVHRARRMLRAVFQEEPR
jgi:RNA polymerase sigma-70 factor (ECF subfamily)